MPKKPLAVSKSDLKILRKFANWTNAIQVFDDGRYEVGFMPENAISRLMVAEGWLNGKAPPAGFYSTEALKGIGVYAVEETPFFDFSFVIDPNIDGEELTDFFVPEADWLEAKSGLLNYLKMTETDDPVVYEKGMVRLRYYIVPLDESAASYIDHYGKEKIYRSQIKMPFGKTMGLGDQTFARGMLDETFTLFPVASENVGQAFKIHSEFINAMPLTDYNVTAMKNHIFIFESEEFGFNIYIRGWMNEDHVKMRPHRSSEDQWIPDKDGLKYLVKRMEAVYGNKEKVKITEDDL